MSANSKQIGGNHYKKGGEEHWDRQWRLYGRGYFVGAITKYVERYHEKDGVKDLQKAIHFIEKLIELETAAEIKRRETDDHEDKWVQVTVTAEGDATRAYVNQD